jgi:hypothetical protein
VPSLGNAHFHPPKFGLTQSGSKEHSAEPKLIVPLRPDEKYKAMSSGIGMAAAAFIVIPFLLGDHKFLDTILCLVFFVPYSIWVSRDGRIGSIDRLATFSDEDVGHPGPCTLAFDQPFSLHAV